MSPAVSVVIPTYNWSAALRLAIRSVLLQTVQDFEIVVVGDGCTDDSAAVVAEFGDPRLRWHNLERNHGSQWVANNHANRMARGEWIAYLGHDDIWHPAHLEAVLRAARREQAEIVASTMILYGPEGSGAREIAGVFSGGAWGPGDFVPPSAFAHRRSLHGDVVLWRDPDRVELPMDAAFIDDLAASGRKFAATGELTCFKFNAAWRRDLDVTRVVAEQQRMLARIEEAIASGTDFRHAELHDVIQAVVSRRFNAVRAPAVAGVARGSRVRVNRRNKGLDSRFEPSELRRIDGPVRFDMSGQGMPYEWWALEEHPVHGSIRWTGPSPRATIDLPVVFDRDLAIRIHVVAMARPELADALRLSIHGQPLETGVRRLDSTFLVEARVRRAEIPPSGRDFGVTVEAGAVAQACVDGPAPDPRWVGLAVNWIELEPAG